MKILSYLHFNWWSNRIHKATIQPLRILWCRRPLKKHSKSVLWVLKISKRSALIFLSKDKKLSMINYKKRIKNNLLLQEFTRVLSLMVPEWKKCRQDMGTFFWYNQKSPRDYFSGINPYLLKINNKQKWILRFA